MGLPSLSSPQTPTSVDMDKIRLRLQRMIPMLAEFGCREEAQFVEIGEALGAFLQRSRAIARCSDEVLNSLLRKEGDEILISLGELMDGLENHINQLHMAASHHEESLQQVTVHIHRIEAPLQSLSKIIKILYSLSFSTKVESTQGNSVVVLDALAEDLKGLAIKINGKTDAVRDRLKIMLSLAQGAQDKTRVMAAVALRQARANLQQCRRLIDAVASRRAAVLTDVRLLHDDSDTISAAIDEVVSSVQFHDITRQQVEHVQIALQDFCGRMEQDSGADLFAAEVVGLCRIQSAQLCHTRHDLVSAVVRMIGSLRSIAPAVDHLAKKTHRLSETTEAAGASLIGDIEPVLALVTSIIDEADQEDRQVTAAVDAVLNVLNELSQLLQEVESIGTEMKMISFNAGITAAHNLERGAGLGVIARSIQNLSSEVLGRTHEFANVYGQMESLARELSGGANAFLPQEVTGATQLNESVATFMARLQMMNKGVVQLMDNLDKEALSLATDVVTTADKITIHIEAGKIIDPLVAELESLAESVHVSSSPAGVPKVVDLSSRHYTMQSERRVHAEVRQSDSVVMESPRQDRTGLGTNVELF